MRDCEHGIYSPLVGGLTNSTRRLEICAHGVWGKVCNRLFGPENARGVCNQLGISNQGRLCYSTLAKTLPLL